jgi:hypothetical protein
LIGRPSLEQFAVDAWHAPERIFDAHPPDQYTQLGVDLRLAGYRPRQKLQPDRYEHTCFFGKVR